VRDRPAQQSARRTFMRTDGIITLSEKYLTRAGARTPAHTRTHEHARELFRAISARPSRFFLSGDGGGKIGRRAALLPHAHTFGSDFVGPRKIIKSADILGFC
jgi:hypothetical protein